MFVSLLALFFVGRFGWPGGIGVGLAALLLVRQHSLVKADDLSRLDAAFFTTNAMLSVILLITMGSDLFLR
jgi:4-hydroxybenzoate polyprenyltransferase